MDQGPGQPELLKEINRSRLIEVLQAARVVSRPELARQAGLSRTTIGILADELLRIGLVREVGLASSTGGRPARLLEYNPDAAYALGAHMADREWSIVLVNLDAHVLHRQTLSIPDDTPWTAVETLREGVLAIMRLKVPGLLLPAIGLGTPGLVDVRAGVVKTAVDVGWSEVPIRQMVEGRLGLRAFVVNRSKVGALAEVSHGAGRDVDDIIYISIGTGIAAGIVHQRRLYSGASSAAGELGHVTVLPGGPLCPCGNHGCLQQLASGPAIANLARARMREAHGSLLHSLAGNHPELVKAETVFRAAEQGDSLAQEIVGEVATYLGIVVANLINLLNPQLIVLGGSVGRDARVLLAPLQEEVRRRAMAYPLSSVRIVTSALGTEASAIGAAALVLQHIDELLFARQVPLSPAGV